MSGRGYIRRGVMLAMLLLPFLAVAQQPFQRWAGGVDDDVLHYGFSFHYVHADYKIKLREQWQTPFVDDDGNVMGSPNAIHSPFTHGVGLGLLADLKLNDNLNLRLTPNIVFSNKRVVYQFDPAGTYLHSEQISKLIRASYVDIPLFVKFRSDRKNNYRGYLIAGGKYSINVVSKRRYDDSDEPTYGKELKTKPGYFAYEAGIGFEIYFDYFKMSPEIRWSQSIGNLLDRKEANMFNHPIDRLMLRNFQISLIFE